MRSRNHKQFPAGRMNFPGLLLRVFSAASCSAAIAFSTTVPAQDIGTLFTTAEEREYLDYLRQDFVNRSQMATFNIDEDVIPDIPEVTEVEVEAVQVTEYRFGGIMTRRNGSRMVWFNGNQVAEQDLPSNLSIIEDAGGFLLGITVGNERFLLKAGQSININTGNPVEPVPDEDPAESEAADEEMPVLADAGNTAEAEAANSESEQSDLGQVLQQLNPDGGEPTESQMQQALNILTEQADSQ